MPVPQNATTATTQAATTTNAVRFASCSAASFARRVPMRARPGCSGVRRARSLQLCARGLVVRAHDDAQIVDHHVERAVELAAQHKRRGERVDARGGVGVGDERVGDARKSSAPSFSVADKSRFFSFAASTGTFAFCAVTSLISIAKRATVSLIVAS